MAPAVGWASMISELFDPDAWRPVPGLDFTDMTTITDAELRALQDWHYLLERQSAVDLSINLPISFFDDPESFDYLCRQLPDDPAFKGLILEVDGSEITRDLSAARNFARQARLRKMAISVDRLGGEWTALLQSRDFPFVEIKVEPELVAGCAHNRGLPGAGSRRRPGSAPAGGGPAGPRWARRQ